MVKDMFLKIQYGPTSSAYYTDFTKINFTSHLDSYACVVVNEEKLGDDILVHGDFLGEERGCSKHEKKKNAWYLNRVTLTFRQHKDMVDPHTRDILYSGHAYLCNSDGKTVDILR